MLSFDWSKYKISFYDSNETKSPVVHVAVVKENKLAQSEEKITRILLIFAENGPILLLNMLLSFMTRLINAGELNIDQTYFQVSNLHATLDSVCFVEKAIYSCENLNQPMQ